MASTEHNLIRNAGLSESDSIFDRCTWFYAMCREHLFRDHTAEIAQSLFPLPPEDGTVLLELGCGPGFYARRLAQLFPQIKATGIDLSERLIQVARSRAASRSVHNCNFCWGDAQALPELPSRVDAIIVSRLFLIVQNKRAVLSEVFRVLQPGGRCFIAEPTSVFRTRIPLFVMWALVGRSNRSLARYREPYRAEIMSRSDFTEVIFSQPWASVDITHDGWYQYAVCTKGLAEASPAAASKSTGKDSL